MSSELHVGKTHAENATRPVDAVSSSIVPPIPLKRQLRVRRDGKLASPKAIVQTVSSAEMTPKSEASRDHSSESTSSPPKKMMKMRADGKLTSPKVSSAKAEAKKRGRKKPVNIDASAKKRCVVILRYGTNHGTRQSLGICIEAVLTGLACRRKSLASASALTKPPEPVKATHPFFTGSCHSKIVPASRAQSRERAQADPTSQILRPKQSRVTSKPPGILCNVETPSASTIPAFGTDYAKITRFPGAKDPIWPSSDMLHVGYSPPILPSQSSTSLVPRCEIGHRKLKDTRVQVASGEDVLRPLLEMANSFVSDHRALRQTVARECREFRRPQRKIMTNRELQHAVCSRLACGTTLHDSVEGLHVPQTAHISTPLSKAPVHCALSQAFRSLAAARSAFDLSQCETQDWTHKYAPKMAEFVLQRGPEALLLRDWLKTLTVTSAEQKGDTSRHVARSAKSFKKRRRRADDLDGFLVSSDDENNAMDAIIHHDDGTVNHPCEARSLIRAEKLGNDERRANAVIISGPHGCGKTSAVYAAAQELGFEVFEVNAGSRRNGKDILDKVGDMTRNHLVKHRQERANSLPEGDEASESQESDAKLQADLANGRQATMNAFLKAKSISGARKATVKAEARGSRTPKMDPKEDTIKTQQQFEEKRTKQPPRQSLILLEEVDVLFEEDKMFWSTVLELIFRSKRPVIMTCSDEKLLPLDEMFLYAIFRFTPPPEALATDYLLLVAANEGHLLSYESVNALYNVKDSDLRASLTELNFYCQMGVGDNKGGLEWMLIASSSHKLETKDGELLRVISADTYNIGMGWIGGEIPKIKGDENLNDKIQLYADTWNGWHFDLGANEPLIETGLIDSQNSCRAKTIDTLQQLDESYAAFSAADLLPADAVRAQGSVRLDTTEQLTDKLRSSYVDGPVLLQADPIIDQTNLCQSTAFALRACARHMSQPVKKSSSDIDAAYNLIPRMPLKQHSSYTVTISAFRFSFEPLSIYTNPSLGIPKGFGVTNFDNPISTVAQDIAPYVRGIVAYDLRLEEQRRQLASLAAQPGKDGQNTRRTRASRAALEGGTKADTRRERWFPSQVDLGAILRTGGHDWQNVACEMINAEADEAAINPEGSTRSSSVDPISATGDA